MSDFSFRGTIADGIGKFVQLHVPGRAELANAPADWPDVLEKGSLNVKIASDGYPQKFVEGGLPNTTKSLDQRPCPAAFEIAQNQFGNNRLEATHQMPHRGSAQVWRAVLHTDAEVYPCWVLRRYGSGLHDQLELLSHEKIRDALNLQNGQPVVVVFQTGNAQPAVPSDANASRHLRG